MHRVMTEDLVADTVGRPLDHCGVPFEPSCLRFWEGGRAVSTHSSQQVHADLSRQPGAMAQLRPLARTATRRSRPGAGELARGRAAAVTASHPRWARSRYRDKQYVIKLVAMVPMGGYEVVSAPPYRQRQGFTRMTTSTLTFTTTSPRTVDGTFGPGLVWSLPSFLNPSFTASFGTSLFDYSMFATISGAAGLSGGWI